MLRITREEKAKKQQSESKRSRGRSRKVARIKIESEEKEDVNDSLNNSKKEESSRTRYAMRSRKI